MFSVALTELKNTWADLDGSFTRGLDVLSLIFVINIWLQIYTRYLNIEILGFGEKLGLEF